ncbi:hypothetical protein EVAR_8999_1 [Eumeta japonica]|uniref:Uncharacterized protein n=1 Tax=Eumeta variegata TaxID=151549 RepID=A0A4C1WRN4_EUMVA|nr:hypothetical protein EVAR_8999_1 [Eumeta japonica]
MYSRKLWVCLIGSSRRAATYVHRDFTIHGFPRGRGEWASVVSARSLPPRRPPAPPAPRPTDGQKIHFAAGTKSGASAGALLLRPVTTLLYCGAQHALC